MRQIWDDVLSTSIIHLALFASAIVPVRKKDTLKTCVHYRQVNKITVVDRFPIPLIEDYVEHLGNKSVFTILKNGFHYDKMHTDSIKFTAFVTPDGQFEHVS